MEQNDSDLLGVLSRLALLLEDFEQSLPLVLTRERAARELSVSTKTLVRMVQRGEIAEVMRSGRPGIPSSEIRRIATPAPAPSRKARKPASKPSPSGSSSLRAKLRKMRSP